MNVVVLSIAFEFISDSLMSGNFNEMFGGIFSESSDTTGIEYHKIELDDDEDNNDDDEIDDNEIVDDEIHSNKVRRKRMIIMSMISMMLSLFL